MDWQGGENQDVVHLGSRRAFSHPNPAALGLGNDQDKVNPFLGVLTDVFKGFLVMGISGLVGENTIWRPIWGLLFCSSGSAAVLIVLAT